MAKFKLWSSYFYFGGLVLDEDAAAGPYLYIAVEHSLTLTFSKETAMCVLSFLHIFISISDTSYYLRTR